MKQFGERLPSALVGGGATCTLTFCNKTELRGVAVVFRISVGMNVVLLAENLRGRQVRAPLAG